MHSVYSVLFLCVTSLRVACSFHVSQPLHFKRTASALFEAPDASTTTAASTTMSTDPLGLTPELRRVTDAFRMIGDDQLRYKQLLYMATNLEELPRESMIPENKVPGCLSTVFVDGHASFDESRGEYVVHFVGDSDGLLTKGLVALLVRGLSGSTASEIQEVDPVFIKEAQIEQSLTPGRNNGFLNMLKVMKTKALEFEQAAQSPGSETPPQEGGDDNSNNGRPMYNAILTSLQMLKPESIELVDNSDQHAGHSGNPDGSGESHFEVQIVAEAFEGLPLVKRHQLVYMMLGELMPKIHALQIRAHTPEEASS